jgi:hypothetical protein
MLPTFLAQFAAGCYLAVAVSAIRESGWRYLRLMAVVSLVLTLFSLTVLLKDPVAARGVQRMCIYYGLAIAVVFGAMWLFVNAVQSERISNGQRLFPAVAGLSAMVSAVALVLRPDNLLASANSSPIAIPQIAMAVTTILGAALLGTVTAAMLLGHRYLTDTDMSIVPLRRLARFYLIIVAIRVVWLALASLPLWAASFHPRGEYTWFWLMVSVRCGVGVLCTGVFAWMVWDCVKRRATQSATAIFYLSMIFVFLGELSGQYLTRTESLAM